MAHFLVTSLELIPWLFYIQTEQDIATLVKFQLNS